MLLSPREALPFISNYVYVCVRACACVRACVRACGRACGRACVRACACDVCNYNYTQISLSEMFYNWFSHVLIQTMSCSCIRAANRNLYEITTG